MPIFLVTQSNTIDSYENKSWLFDVVFKSHYFKYEIGSPPIFENQFSRQTIVSWSTYIFDIVQQKFRSVDFYSHLDSFTFRQIF